MFKDHTLFKINFFVLLFVKSPFGYVGTASCRSPPSVYPLYFKVVNYYSIGFTLNLTFHVLLVGYRKLLKGEYFLTFSWGTNGL